MGITVLNRKQFKEVLCVGIAASLASPKSPLWIPETAQGQRVRCRWFVCVKPVRVQPPQHWEYSDLQTYWDWCDENLKGPVRCFSASSDEEWWGFKYKKDVNWWVLKWAK